MPDYSLEISPEEKLKYKKQAYKSFGNLQPALDNTQQLARQQYGRQATEGLIGARSEDISKGLGKAAAGAAQMIPQQQAEQNALSMQGAGMEQDIIGQKQAGALKNFATKQQTSQDDAARSVANRAFQLGMEAKQLVFHDTAKVTDLAFEQLNKDYQANRTTKQELLKIQNEFRNQAVQLKTEADIELTKAMGEAKLDMMNGNAARAKTRITKALDKQKAAAKAASKASNIGGIVTGALTIAGGIVAGVYSGGAAAPAGAAGGAAVGKGLESTGIYN